VSGVGPLVRGDVPNSAVDFHCSNILDEILADPQVIIKIIIIIIINMRMLVKSSSFIHLRLPR
jgi:hypothetical protein